MKNQKIINCEFILTHHKQNSSWPFGPPSKPSINASALHFVSKQKKKKRNKIKINYYQRAETLIGSLGSEKDRWSESALALNDSLVNVVGDVLLAGGCVAYLGCFTVDVCIPHTIHINYKFFMLVEL